MPAGTITTIVIVGFFLVLTIPFDVVAIKAKFLPFAIVGNLLFGGMAVSFIVSDLHNNYVNANDKILYTKEIVITGFYVDDSSIGVEADYVEDSSGTRYLIYERKLFSSIEKGDKAIVEIHSLEEPRIKSVDGVSNDVEK